jgi:outer membrane protein OmpA-like peptidoglycan-associated protein
MKMRKLIALTVVFAMLGVCGSAQAAKVWDDMSWWGNTGATPAPVADSKGRSGYWWWPTEAASNAGDTELWGNRGIVYHAWEQPAVPEPVAPPVEVPTAAVRTAILMNNVLFDFDKAVLKPEGKAEVDRLVAEMNKYPTDSVTVVGHTCNVGTEAYNMGLGQRRSDAVKAYLVASGIAAERITSVSKGESEPAVPNMGKNSENNKLNRRAEFAILLGE